LRAWSICSGVNFTFTPRRCAAFTQARVRSEIKDLSSSAKTPIICHIARPVGVAVSIAWVSREFHAKDAEIAQHRYQLG
jgi:hypothetical protein